MKKTFSAYHVLTGELTNSPSVCDDSKSQGDVKDDSDSINQSLLIRVAH